jgi:cbb3-type cytochrome oxidase maturation protein
MDILFLLVPLSVLLALAVMGVLAWAVWSGQFEELESEGQRIFQQDAVQGNKVAQQNPKNA